MSIDIEDVLHSRIINTTIRKWQCSNTELAPHNFMYPLFIVEEDDAKETIASLPNVYRYGIKTAIEHLDQVVPLGLESILLFGVVGTNRKNPYGSFADDLQNPVIRILPILKKKYPDLTVACDVCLCPYTNHGHCAILNDEYNILEEDTNDRLATIALSYAKAGADIVAPSDMMDGRIASIKRSLSENGLISRVNVLSYSAKFASSLYGPFRDAAGSAPSMGDRKNYQLPPGSKGMALAATKRDVREGCDMLMVKPALAYLDIVKQTKETFPDYPLFVYQVSGEYAMLYHSAKAGVFNLKTVLNEVFTSMRRAGADVIISYYTPLVLQWLSETCVKPTKYHKFSDDFP